LLYTWTQDWFIPRSSRVGSDSHALIWAAQET
jgi:hypothetical protein